MGIMRATSLIFCGVSLTIGCISLVLAARRFHPVRHALFAAGSLAVCVYSILTLLAYDAVSLPRYDALMRIQIWFTAGAIVLYMWFVRDLANTKNKAFLVLYSAGWGVLTIVRFFHPTYFNYSRLRGVSSALLPTGERISLLDADPSPGYAVLFALILVSWGYLAVQGISMFARGNKRHGLLTLASLTASIAFIVNDILVTVGAYRGVYTAEFSMSGFVILMGLALADDVVQKERIGRELDRTEKLRTLGLLAGGVAHDFNNQLTALLGYAELIRESARRDPALDQCAAAIMQAVERSRDMTARLPAFARKEKKSDAPVPLDALLRDTIALIERAFKKNIEIRGEIEGTDLTVWVVDDEELIRSMIRTMLTQERRPVRVFASGEECLAALESLERERSESPQAAFPPQAAVLDMILPGIGCRGIFTRLRAVFPDLPVVLVSGAAADLELKAFTAAGNVTFLGKPFRKAELLLALGSARSGSSSRIQ
ncbi:MAG: response regulator [Spirochaetales bacterium]|nr:response regulator [Spirochaetales bacterium]